MKIAFIIVLSLVVIFVGVRVVGFLEEQRALQQNLGDVQSRLATAKTQEANLEEEMQYLSDPANLEKELREQFNYKNPGETMVILVPQTASSTP
ncbi:MAG TPA: septum formation initiator family protein [Candidatus Paceibacterota bacterium]|nr:septum formation initiator family protein [Candidatus Paceibacterota bacterium]